MRKILFINADPALKAVLRTATRSFEIEVEDVDQWGEARHQLFLNRYDMVCLNYDDFKIEGLDSFILLDNILQKEATPGLILLRQHSERASQLAESLASLQKVVEYGEEANLEGLLRQAIGTILGATEPKPIPAPVAPLAAASEPAGTIEVEVRLPKLTEGDIERVPLSRLLYALSVHRSTGILELKLGDVARRYPFSEGSFMETGGSSFADSASLKSAFAWTTGRFRFEERQAISGNAVSTFALIVSGIDTHLTPRRVMDALMPLMKSYPVATQLWARQRRHVDWPALSAVMGHCTGSATLESVLGKMGPEVTMGFKAALLARDADLIFFRPDATSRTVVISYGPQVNLDPDSANDDEQRKKTKAYRAAGSERADLERELRLFYKSIQGYTAHQTFGVWKGCGRDVVKERFYIMVKEHHPDVYGGNVSDEVKRLAQRIFIAVKDAYTELMKIETTQTVGPPAPEVEAAPPARPMRAKMDTPLAGQMSVSKAKAAGAAASAENASWSRANHVSAPIGLGREPSEAHPDLESAEARKDKLDRLAQRARRPAQITGVTKLSHPVPARSTPSPSPSPGAT
ncbi:MAG: DUF4388 domain-containing protein, partial [Bradymonadaceae bacterium]|nr:DUF4388 domain-containing protein [Lujinxingiaceae bacterium]